MATGGDHGLDLADAFAALRTAIQVAEDSGSGMGAIGDGAVNGTTVQSIAIADIHDAVPVSLTAIATRLHLHIARVRRIVEAYAIGSHLRCENSLFTGEDQSRCQRRGPLMFMWQSGSTLDSLAALVRQFNRFLKAEPREQQRPPQSRGQSSRITPRTPPLGRPTSPDSRK